MKKLAGIRFILTQKCNYHCVYCHGENLKERVIEFKMDNKIIDEIIKEAALRGVGVVSVTGGEPFLSDKLFELLNIAKKYKQYTIVNTNGSVLGKYINKLPGVVDEVHIHLPSLKSTTYGKITGNYKTLKTVLRNLSLLKKRTNIKIYLNIPVVHGINECELRSIYEFAEKFGFKCRFLEIFPISKDILNYYIDINKVMKKYFPDFRKISTYDYGISKYEKNSSESIYTCRCMCFDEKCHGCLKNHYLHIIPNMKIKPCSLRETILDCNLNTVSADFDGAIDYFNGIKSLPVKYKKIFRLAKRAK